MYISGKHAEEVGLEKLAKRQAQLLGIHTLVLDRMCIRYREGDDEADRSIADLCANITTLDLSGNLFETWDEILLLCRLFPKLHSLTLDGNRLCGTVSESGSGLPNIRYLGLTNTLLEPAEIASLTSYVPALQTLILTNNELEGWESGTDTILPSTVHSIDLSNNHFDTLSSLGTVLTLPKLHTLILKANKIGSRSPQPSTSPLSETLKTLDLRANEIAAWPHISSLPTVFPDLTNLLIANNPLYSNLVSAENTPLTADDGYTLTLARLPLLQTLNHSTITDKERLNAETYYLGQIARELAKTPAEKRAKVLDSHPRWEALCAEYGEPVITGPRTGGEIDPASLAARLVRVTFHLASDSAKHPISSKSFEADYTWTEEVPRSTSIYSLLGRVGKKLDVMPLSLRLVWETGEKDPVGAGGSAGDAPEYWDSSDGEDESEGKGEWVAREVELAAGTRAVGSYLEGLGGTVRVEVVG